MAGDTHCVGAGGHPGPWGGVPCRQWGNRSGAVAGGIGENCTLDFGLLRSHL